MDQKLEALDAAERSRRWRAGITTRLDEIRSELERLIATLEAERIAALDRLGERQSGRRQ